MKLQVKKLAGAAGAGLLAVTVLAGCGGIAQDEHDAIVAALHSELSDSQVIIVDLETELERLIADIDTYQGEVESLSGEVRSLNARVSQKQATLDGLGPNIDLTAEEVAIRRSELERESRVTALDAQVSQRERQIEELETELQRLRTRIVETGDEPIRLAAGTWYVGTDVPPGRYRVTGSSNFFVERPGGGFLDFTNIILGRHGVAEYVMSVSRGDVIQTRGGATLTPIR